MQRKINVKATHLLAAASMFALLGCSNDTFWGAGTPPEDMHAEHAKADGPQVNRYFRPEEKVTEGTVEVEGNSIDYRAIAGTLVVHARGFDDAAAKPDDKGDAKDAPPEASMSFVAYMKQDESPHTRPITFVYNGGPGSATVWLHMGAFGPRRILTPGDTHMQAAPYRLVNNDYSLLDATDLVFVDAPGTGFGRIMGKDKEKAFFGTDADAYAFSQFITQFLTKHGRWNSPKYLFGESYGTPRSAALINVLETQDNLDFNGVILLSQILNYDLSTGRAEINAGIDLPYILALPHLCGDGLVSSQASRQFASAGTVAAGSRSLRARRLSAGAGRRRAAEPGQARRDRGEAPQLYGAVGRLHHEGRSAHRRR